MEKIMVIGCPGSGKSTLSKQLGQLLDIPVLHLDYIYHIDSFHQISKEELKLMIESFVTNHDSFIIDGNYNATMEWRLQFCDTVIVLDIDTEICVQNVMQRINETNKDDIIPELDNQVLDEAFLEFVRGFRESKLPAIKARLQKFDQEVVFLENYDMIKSFIHKVQKAITK